MFTILHYITLNQQNILTIDEWQGFQLSKIQVKIQKAINIQQVIY